MPLDWKDRLQKASYRGVPFLVTSSSLEAGRRGSVQEFPQRDVPYVEDLGRKARRHTIEAIVLGADYMTRRDKLLEVCSKRGLGFPKVVGGILRHPYLGDLRVFCLSVRITETVRAGRMCRVSMEFVESGEPPAPKAATSPAAEAADAAGDAADQSEAFAVSRIEEAGPESVRQAISGELRKLGNKLASLDIFTGPAGDVALLAADIEALITNAVGLAKAPADAVAKVRIAIGRIEGAVARAADAAFAYEALFALEPDSIGGKGGTGIQADLNAAAIVDQIHETAVVHLAASLSARTDWRSRDEALDQRDALLEKLESVMETEDPDLQVRLTRVLSLVGKAIPPSSQRLPRILEVTLPADTPSLVLAYLLYDDPDRDQEVADRIGAERPGFLPGGVPLEVLTDA